MLAKDDTRERGWKFYKVEGEASMGIVPMNDRKTHVFSHECHCSPTMQVIAGTEFWSHQSYDGREIEECNPAISAGH